MKKIAFKQLNKKYLAEMVNKLIDVNSETIEVIQPLVDNGLCLRLRKEGSEMGTYINVTICDYQHELHCIDFLIADFDEDFDWNVEYLYEEILKTSRHFYTDYLRYCITFRNEAPIRLPGCPTIYWDKKKYQFYCYENGEKEWCGSEQGVESIVRSWEKKSNLFWLED